MVEKERREWTGLEYGESDRAVKSRQRWRQMLVRTSVLSPTTLRVNGQMDG